MQVRKLTKRYSIDEVAAMLERDALSIRKALRELQAQKELSAETFLFANGVWRITPTDVSKIQNQLEAMVDSVSHSSHERKIRKRILKRTD